MRSLLCAVVLGFFTCCAGPPHPGPYVPTGQGTPVWLYEVVANKGGRELSVTASFPAGSDDELGMVDRADTFVTGLEREIKGGWAPIKHHGSSFIAPECAAGCRVRYRYKLGEAAASWGDVSLARIDDGAVESPPSTWLLRPSRAVPDTKIWFHVTTPPGESFVTGVFGANIPDTYEAGIGESMQLPYSAFGSLRVHELQDGGATLAFLPGVLPEADVLAWAAASLATVCEFYGRLPLRHVLILVRPSDDEGVGFGSTMGYFGGAISIAVGEKATKESFRRDWILVHELVHTALPDLPRAQHWLEEGLATYVEPIARVRQGALTPREVWADWAKSMSQGEPEAGDEGLDITHTWGRTYWGGALFCFMADVEIRKQTLGAFSLQVALRAILEAGGNIAVSWPLSKILEVGDAATGTKVLSTLYEKMGHSPSPVNLAKMFDRLGVALTPDGSVTFNDKAELAWVRNSITPARPILALCAPKNPDQPMLVKEPTAF